jgi:hypothetical protein
MKNSAIKYQKKTLILSPARIKVYLSTNSILKLLQDNKEKKNIISNENRETIYRRNTSPIAMAHES